MTKKPSSGVEIGLWVVSGFVGLYFLGAAILIADAQYFKTRWILNNAPDQVVATLEILYMPLDALLTLLLRRTP